VTITAPNEHKRNTDIVLNGSDTVSVDAVLKSRGAGDRSRVDERGHQYGKPNYQHNISNQKY